MVLDILTLADNQRFLTRSKDGTIKLWDLINAKEIHSYQTYSQMVLLPGSQSFFTYHESVKHWGLTTGELLNNFEGFGGSVEEIILLSPNLVGLENL